MTKREFVKFTDYIKFMLTTGLDERTTEFFRYKLKVFNSPHWRKQYVR